MTYDPRRGGSTYLGMEADEDLTSEEPSYDRPAPSAAADAVLPRTTRPTDVPATIRRPSQAPRRAVAPAPAPASRRVPVAVPSPQQRPYEAPRPQVVPRQPRRSRPLAALESFSLRLLALVLRLGAIFLAFLVVASTVLSGSLRAQLVSSLNMAPLLVPPALLGQFVVETPFGGVFRGDLAIASIIFFCADWVCMRFSTSLRERRERGA